MVNVTVDKLGPCKRRLSIEVPVQEVQSELDAVYSEIAKTAKVPGFRPGKVPRRILETRFKDDAVEESQKRLVSKFYQDSLERNNLTPVHAPKIDDLNYQAGCLTFTAEFEIEPEFELKKYTDIKVNVSKVDVTPKDIDDYIDRLRESHATLEAVEGRSALVGDYMLINYKLIDENKEVVESGDSKLFYLNEDFLKESGHFISDFIKEVEGLNVGDKKTIKTKLPENYHKSEFAGRSVDAEIEVVEIKERILPELNDEYIKSLGKFENIDRLREEVKKVIEDQKKNEQRMEARDQIIEHLTESHDFDLPQTVVDSQLQQILQEKYQAYYKSNSNEKFDVDKIKEESTPDAQMRVKISYILADIAEKENIKVDPGEIEANIRYTASSLNMKYDQLRKQLVESGRIYSIHQQMLNDKVINYLYEKAKVTEK